MLKRIDRQQIRAGMFVEDMEGAWHSNPLQRRRFMLNGAAAQQLRASDLRGVVINTAKGIDAIPAVATDPRVVSAGLAERAKLDASAASQTVQQSSALLSDMFVSAGAGGAISFDGTAHITAEISKSIDHNPSMFISVTRLKSKDEATFVHSVAVSALMIHFGRHLRLDEETVQLLGVAGLLHDVGKIEVPGTILNKQGSLDDAEMRVMRDHPLLGHKILSRQDGMPEMVLDICLHHHERIDGKGYPEQLSGDRLSFPARLAAICDVYDAVTSVRPYKKPWTASEALSWMLRRDGQFDHKLLKKFIACLTATLPRT